MDKDKPQHFSDAADDPFGGDDEVDPSGDASEDLTRKQFVSETRSYQAYRKKKWNECKEQGGHRFLLDQDPLEEWPKLGSQFPMLALLAEYILSIPAASAGAERFFSALARILTKDRYSIERKFVGKLITSHMRNRSVKSITVQKIPEFGIIPDDIEIDDWEEMYDSDYEDDDEGQDDMDYELNALDFEDEEIDGEETHAGKRMRVSFDTRNENCSTNDAIINFE